MEVFKLFESTIASVQPGHISTKDLRRDQLLDNYDDATKTLETLIKAKENEIAYRRDLIDMLEKSKVIYDKKLMQAKQAYQTAKKHAPESLDLKVTHSKKVATAPSTTSSTATPTATVVVTSQVATGSQQSPLKSSDLDIPLPSEIMENRSSLDRRLSEFLKTFPNLTQAGLAQQSPNTNNIKPLPGYYTQQPPPPPPISSAPPLMAMMRFPPPPLVPPPPTTTAHHIINPSSQENHDTADMELSDYDESSNNSGAPAGGIIPMVASAMQQGAGGKQHLRAEMQQSYVAGQQFNNPIQYAPRLNPLPFDPSIMDSRLRDSPSSSGSRDKHSSHSERGSHRHSSSSGGSSSGVKHGSDRNKYSSSSSHSSSRNKRR